MFLWALLENLLGYNQVLVQLLKFSVMTFGPFDAAEFCSNSASGPSGLWHVAGVCEGIYHRWEIRLLCLLTQLSLVGRFPATLQT